MSPYKFVMVVGLLVNLAASGCSTSETITATSASNELTNIKMKHTIKEIVEYDSIKMTKLLNREFKINDYRDDDDGYFNNAARVLGETVLVQPHFAEREATIREFKGKLDQADYLIVLPKAANNLMNLAGSSNPAEQASAYVALTNLVIELRAMYDRSVEARDQLHAILVRVRDARFKVSEADEKYAHETLTLLISPSDEAEASLKELESPRS